jgi:hypothetical protein
VPRGTSAEAASINMAVELVRQEHPNARRWPNSFNGVELLP